MMRLRVDVGSAPLGLFGIFIDVCGGEQAGHRERGSKSRYREQAEQPHQENYYHLSTLGDIPKDRDQSVDVPPAIHLLQL